MEKFFCDLEEVLEKYNTDVTALDDYEVAAFHYTKFCKELKTLPFANNFKYIYHQHQCESIQMLPNRWKSTLSAQ